MARLQGNRAGDRLGIVFSRLDKPLRREGWRGLRSRSIPNIGLGALLRVLLGVLLGGVLLGIRGVIRCVTCGEVGSPSSGACSRELSLEA